jgi:hypothetical protein
MRRTSSTSRCCAIALHRVWIAKTILPSLRHVFSHDAVGERETERAICFAPNSRLESLAAFRDQHLWCLGLGRCWPLGSDLIRAWTERTRCVVGMVDRFSVNHCLLSPSWTSMSWHENHALPSEQRFLLFSSSHHHHHRQHPGKGFPRQLRGSDRGPLRKISTGVLHTSSANLPARCPSPQVDRNNYPGVLLWLS